MKEWTLASWGLDDVGGLKELVLASYSAAKDMARACSSMASSVGEASPDSPLSWQSEATIRSPLAWYMVQHSKYYMDKTTIFSVFLQEILVQYFFSVGNPYLKYFRTWSRYD